MEYGRKTAHLPRSSEEKDQWRRVVVILEHCPLESIHSDQGGWELLCDKHKRVLGRRNIDPADMRPDVVHQTLLHLMDSPLNRAGMLQVFIKSQKNVLISVDPRLRIPRSPRLFSKMMAQVLFHLKVRVDGTGEASTTSSSRLSLMRVIKNPVTEHLPSNTRYIRVEKDGDLVVDLLKYCHSLAQSSTKHMKKDSVVGGRKRARWEGEKADHDDDVDVWEPTATGTVDKSLPEQAFHPFAFVIGGMSRGDVDVSYAGNKVGGESIALSNRGMSAAATASLLCHAFEEVWVNEWAQVD